MTRPDASIVHGHSTALVNGAKRASWSGCRCLTRLPPGGHAAFQSVAARRHSPATHHEGHPGRHGGSPPRTPAAPVSTLRTLPTHPSLARPTLRTETTGRLRLGRLVLGVASRHTPPGLHAVLQEPHASCHRTVACRHYSRPFHRTGEVDVTTRPYLGCGQLIASGSRCPQCKRPHTSAERTRRARVVAEWISTYGGWCPGGNDRRTHRPT